MWGHSCSSFEMLEVGITFSISRDWMCVFVHVGVKCCCTLRGWALYMERLSLNIEGLSVFWNKCSGVTEGASCSVCMTSDEYFLTSLTNDVIHWWRYPPLTLSTKNSLYWKLLNLRCLQDYIPIIFFRKIIDTTLLLFSLAQHLQDLFQNLQVQNLSKL